MKTSQQALSRNAITEQVKAIVIEALHAQKMADQITEETYLENLGLDSLNIVDILLGIERDFDIAFDDEELDLSVLESVGSLVEFVVLAKSASV